MKLEMSYPSRRMMLKAVASASALVAVGLPAVAEAALANPVGTIATVHLGQRIDLSGMPWQLCVEAAPPGKGIHEVNVLIDSPLPRKEETPTQYLARPDVDRVRKNIIKAMERVGIDKAHFVDRKVYG